MSSSSPLRLARAIVCTSLLAVAPVVVLACSDNVTNQLTTTNGPDSGATRDAATTSDGSSPGDAPVDSSGSDSGDAAVSRCDPLKPFGAATPLTILNDGTTHDNHATLTSDELTVFFASDRSGGTGPANI
jgi:hypothetical protein